LDAPDNVSRWTDHCILGVHQKLGEHAVAVALDWRDLIDQRQLRVGLEYVRPKVAQNANPPSPTNTRLISGYFFLSVQARAGCPAMASPLLRSVLSTVLTSGERLRDQVRHSDIAFGSL